MNFKSVKELGEIKRTLSNFINWIVNSILFIVVSCAFVPFSPNMPTDGLDPSWQLGMGEAIHKGLSIGENLIFTFGPYAALYTAQFHPATDSMALLAGSYLALSYLLVLYLLGAQDNWCIKGALSLLLGGILYLRDPLFFSYPLILGILVLKNATRSSKTYSILVEVLLFAPLGLLPLIKGSNLILSFGVAFLTALFFIAKKKFQSAAVSILIPILSLCIFWLLSGQSIFNLYSYFRSTQEIISGYSEAMVLSGPNYEIVLYLFVAMLMLIHAYFFNRFNYLCRLYLSSVLLLFFLIAFKAGFVRHDGHAMIAGTSLLIASTLYLYLGSNKHSFGILFFAFIVWLVIDLNYGHTTIQGYFINLKNTHLMAFEGAKKRLFSSKDLDKEFLSRLQEINSKVKIPEVNGTSDIYSYGQSYLIASGNMWNPRPVFQSYSAYTPYLLDKNRDHISGPFAPENIFFGIEPIDGRLPSIEDGSSWPILLSKYEAVNLQDQLLHLKKKPINNEAYRSSIFRNQTASFGDEVIVPKSKNLVFVKIDVKKTIFGKLKNLLFKSSPIEIVLNFEEGPPRSYKIYPGMISSGFLISPFIHNISDFADLYIYPRVNELMYVKSFMIRANRGRFEWAKTYDIEFSIVQEPKKNRNFYLKPLDGLMLPFPDKLPENVDDCSGSIDLINGHSPTSPIVVRNGSLIVSGWLSQLEGKVSQPRRAVVVLEAKKSFGKKMLLMTNKISRPDVALATGIPAMKNSGFELAVDLSKIIGNFEISIGFIDRGVVKLCPHFRFPISIYKTYADY